MFLYGIKQKEQLVCQLWIYEYVSINKGSVFFFSNFSEMWYKIMYYKRQWGGMTLSIQCYSYVLNNRNSNPVTSTIFSLLHHKKCGCDSHPFSCSAGFIYFSTEQGGVIVKEKTHVSKANSLGMGGYFPQVYHTSFYGTETQIYRHRNRYITHVLQ